MEIDYHASQKSWKRGMQKPANKYLTIHTYIHCNNIKKKHAYDKW